MKYVFMLFVSFCCLASFSHAFNMKKVGHDISGSIINSVYQDNNGFIWVSTNTGMSRYDGKAATIIPGFIGIKNITGTISNKIIAATLYGLKEYEPRTDSILNHKMFGNTSYVTSDSRGTVFVIQGNGSIYYKMDFQNKFDNILVPGLFSAYIRFFKVVDDILYMISADGVLRTFEIVYNNATILLNEKAAVAIDSSVLHCFESEDCIYFINVNYKLSQLCISSGNVLLIDDLKHSLEDKGKITSGVVFRNEFYFGTEKGLYKIRDHDAVKLSVKTGVTCLLKDKCQDLIWIGTFDDGLYTLSFDHYTIKSNLLLDFSPWVSKPITAICRTDDQSLWLATEGNGIITVPNYNPECEITKAGIITVNNGLPDNVIYSLQKSKYGIWIGCKAGLAFYSYKNKRIKRINDTLKNVNDVCEQDSFLWIACYGKGIVRTSLREKNGLPELSDMQTFSVNNGDESLNRFSSINAENNNLLFINKGLDVFEFINDRLSPIAKNLNTVNQIKSIDNSTFIVSTDFGIYLLSEGRIIQLDHLTSKDIISGKEDDYWLSTNNGLTLYNASLNTFRYFDASYGLIVTEYSNGASYKDEENDILFFGGIHGFTTVRANYYDKAMDYMPVIFLEQLKILGVDKNLKDFVNNNNLVLKSSENVFSITFNALDYIHGNNYIYYYRIGNGQWIDNGNSGVISFTNLGQGEYHLQVKYYNKMLDKESYLKTINISILPPWYRSVYAYITYLLFILLGGYFFFLSVSRRRERQKEEEKIKAEQRRKEEIYEAKLDFFTNIAHEFCTPLTLIYGPCDRILQQKSANPSVLKYAGVINRNAKRMNSLISDLMDFKQIESGYKQPQIKQLNVSEVADSVIDIFKVNTSGTFIQIKKQYHAATFWNSDKEFLMTILSNLLSNAVKYSKGIGIRISISIKNENLLIKVSNPGKGINEKQLSEMFNRYAVLDHVNKNGKWQQNGLGLALTSGMVQLLKGTIEVESIPNEITTFTVCLPEIQESNMLKKEDIRIERPEISYALPDTRYTYKEDRSTVTVIDDDPEMLWFICDVLNDEFNVIPVNEPLVVIDVLLGNKTDIILSDLIMDGLNGIELVRKIKNDKVLSHIPLIIISAAHEPEIQTEVMNAGAEIYITKPFDNNYMKSVIKRLLGRKEDLKDYFASPISAYEINMGKMQHTEHRKFLKKVYEIINKNIQDENLSPGFIASELGMSRRSLYRKLKEVSDKSLLEMLHEARLTIAENLLLKSKFTIDEIVFKSGFSNRVSFYRAFSKKFGCTPVEYVKRNNRLFTL